MANCPKMRPDRCAVPPCRSRHEDAHQSDGEQQPVEGDRLRPDGVRREAGDDDISGPQHDREKGIEKCGFLLEHDV